MILGQRLFDLYQEHYLANMPRCVYCGSRPVLYTPGLCEECETGFDLVPLPERNEYGVAVDCHRWFLVRHERNIVGEGRP